MEPSWKRLSAAAFLLLLFIMAAEMASPIQAKECLRPSGRFKGLCFKSGRCADVYMDEGFYLGGRCGGLLLKCFCREQCETGA